MTRRAVALVVAAVAALVLGAAPAGAHNNRTVLAGERGAFDLVVAVADVTRGPERGLLVEVTVRTAGDRRDVADASVTVGGRANGTTARPRTADGYGSTYRALLPGAEVEEWDLVIEVAAPSAGSVRVEVTAPGPAALHGAVLADSGSDPATGVWAVVGVGLAVAVAALGLATTGTGALRAAGALQVLAATLVVVGAWSASTADAGAKALSVLPAGVAVVALVAGVVLTGRRPDGLALVFAGAAGLAAVVGWAERAALVDRYVESGLAPDLARAGVVVVLGVGAGLAAVAVARSRSALRAVARAGS